MGGRSGGGGSMREQMIMHLPRPRPAHAPTAAAGRRRGAPPRRRSRPRPVAPRRPAAATATDPSAKGGSRKMTSKRRRLAREPSARIGDVRLEAGRAERRCGCRRAPRTSAGSRSTATASAAPRDSASSVSAPLPAKRSSVEQFGEVLAEPVEKRLAHPVGRGPHASAPREAHNAAAKRPPMMRIRRCARTAGRGRGWAPGPVEF